MAQRKKLICYALFGALIGFCIGMYLRSYRVIEIANNCQFRSGLRFQGPLKFINLEANELPSNSQNNLVLIGVMTAKDFLRERTKAVFDTWGQSFPGRIAFFSSEGSYLQGLPIIGLKGVDDRYPPQKKSFMMLHYMYEHYIDKFEWFIRADDDVFIRTDKLEHFLRSIDSSKPQFIGQAGKGNSEEFGLLSLEYDENFCMGGPGVILSRETLRRVAPHIPTCLKNLYSLHEDVEVGRCVQKFAGVPCTWNYEMQAILHHNSSGNEAFTGNLKNKEVHSAITLHPVKKSPLMYRLYAYMHGVKAQEMRQEILMLHRDMSTMSDLLHIAKASRNIAPGVPIFPETLRPPKYLGDHEILGINPTLTKRYPNTSGELIEWNFIAKHIYSATHFNPKRKIESSVKEGLEDIIREIMDNINNYSRQRGRVIEFRDILYAYSRLNTLYGQDFILDMLLIYKKYRGKKMTVPVRRHLYIQRAFTDIQIRETSVFGINITTEKGAYKEFTGRVKKFWNTGIEKLSNTFTLNTNDKSAVEKILPNIIFILPLSGRLNTFKRFLRNYEQVCLKSDTKTDLLIGLYIDESYNEALELVNRLKMLYPSREINSIDLYGNFSRGLSLDLTARSNYASTEDILFFIDVDIVFTTETLERVRSNTVQQQQIYLPIVYSEYGHGDTTDGRESVDITNDSGYFREFGYGVCAIYKSDLLAVDGFVTDIKGWGLEDVKFLDRIIASSHGRGSVLSKIGHELRVFRSVDTSLVHIFHTIHCDKLLDESQYKMCIGTKANTIGSYKFIESLVLTMNNSFVATRQQP
ncbi:chondroitin sulfate synthase 1 [Phlebotomus argentipes]|uniref:chondroitin sulfate synthase 1 n=1 Tax=Phlebotomus argentipes TaxID=94469 RepID=UPI00289308A8|nr:chondroitin sulfate synthase 1 [Phlebotomus argentipes]